MLNHTTFYHQTVIDGLKKLYKVGKKIIQSVAKGQILGSNPVKIDKNIDVLCRGLDVIKLSGRAVGDS